MSDMLMTLHGHSFILGYDINNIVKVFNDLLDFIFTFLANMSLRHLLDIRHLMFQFWILYCLDYNARLE